LASIIIHIQQGYFLPSVASVGVREEVTVNNGDGVTVGMGVGADIQRIQTLCNP